MAKPLWLTTTPNSGSGNGQISNSANEHTGRVARQGTVTVQGTGIEDPKTYSVIQTPKAEFVSFSNGAEMSADKEGGNLTISGKSNSEKLTFAFVGDSKDVEIPASYKASGLTTDNGVEISGDPGASAEYDFSIVLEIPENTTIDEVVRTLKVTSDGGQTSQIAIKQAAGDPYLTLDKEEITIPQAGTSVAVNVSSNTTWTVS